MHNAKDKTYTSEDVQRAAKTLALGRYASLNELKEAYRKLSKTWHPDNCAEDSELCAEMTRKIQSAYDLLKRHIESYKTPMFLEKGKSTSAKQFWHKHFGEDPLWGNKGE